MLEKREECVKHFRMSDNSMLAIIYSDPIHYKDGDKFREIDNSLVLDGEEYENADNSFKVKVSKKFKDKKLITLNSEGHEVSWGYIKKNRKLKKGEHLPQAKYKKIIDHALESKVASEKKIEAKPDTEEKA